MNDKEKLIISKLKMYVHAASLSPFCNMTLKNYKKEVRFLIDYLENTEDIDKSILRLTEDIFKVCYRYYSQQDTSKLHILFLNDAEYDELMAAFYKKAGYEISRGYLSEDSKKVKPSDPSLVNVSMDRCYLLDEDHTLPIKIPNKNTAKEILQKMFEKSGVSNSEKITVMVSPKIDGVGFATSLDNGIFTNPTQKGMTMDGDDTLSMSVKGLIGYSLDDKPFYDKCNVQYEAFIDKKGMDNIEKELGLVYKFPRAAASGIMNRLSNYESTVNGIIERDVFFDNLYFFPITVTGQDIFKDGFENILKLGKVPKELKKSIGIFKGDFDDILEYIYKSYKYWLNMNSELSFDLDGIVITVLSKSIREAMGRKNDCNKYQFAFKFPPKMAYIKVTEIFTSSGNLGRRTPMIKYEPVVIDGSTYDEVPFNSTSDFREFKLAVGDEAILYIAGDAVPKITWDKRCKRGKNKFKKITQCQTCGHEFDYDAALWMCENPRCRDNMVGSVINFFDKLDIDYDSSAAKIVVDAMDKKGWDFMLSNIAKLDPDDVIDIGINMSKKFIKDLNNKLSSVDESVIFSLLGIPTFGSRKSKLLLQNISLTDIIEGFKDNKSELASNISKIKGIGSSGAEALLTNLTEYVKDLEIFKTYNPKPCIASKEKELTEEGRRVANALGINFEDEVIYIKTSVTIDEKWQEALDDLGFKETTSKFKANKDGTNRPRFNLVLTVAGKESSTIDAGREFNLPIVFRDDFMKVYNNQ
jgi:NAD-dependent DNA ligase